LGSKDAKSSENFCVYPLQLWNFVSLMIVHYLTPMLT
jgi:hypothetical protein